MRDRVIPSLGMPKFQIDQRVRFARMPPWVQQLAPDSQRVFEFCLGKIYRIDEIDENGLHVLDVSADVDPVFGGFMNDIRVEGEFLDES